MSVSQYRPCRPPRAKRSAKVIQNWRWLCRRAEVMWTGLVAAGEVGGWIWRRRKKFVPLLMAVGYPPIAYVLLAQSGIDVFTPSSERHVGADQAANAAVQHELANVLCEVGG